MLQFLVNTRLLLAEDCFNLYHKTEALARSSMAFLGFTRKIIVYSWSTINAYSFLSHKWWVPLIKFMVKLTIYVRERVYIYDTSEVRNNFPFHTDLYCFYHIFPNHIKPFSFSVSLRCNCHNSTIFLFIVI